MTRALLSTAVALFLAAASFTPTSAAARGLGGGFSHGGSFGGFSHGGSFGGFSHGGSFGGFSHGGSFGGGFSRGVGGPSMAAPSFRSAPSFSRSAPMVTSNQFRSSAPVITGNNQFRGNFGNFRGNRFADRHHFRGRRLAVGLGFGYPYYDYGYYDDWYPYDDCYQLRHVHDRYGWHWRRVNVCY